MSIQQAVEEVRKVLRWIAELIVTKNWFALLILLIVLVYVLFTPPQLNVLSGFGWLGEDRGGLLTGLLGASLPPGYLPGFVLVELGLIAMALLLAIRTLPPATGDTLADVAERKAIKGLRPFSAEDAAIFAQLQRTQSLRDCLESITSRTFRFGILMGESGCGKTSFLQAGVWPQLRQPEATHHGIYVRLSDQDPIRTIAKAVAEQLELPLDWLMASESAHTLTGDRQATGDAPACPPQLAATQFAKLLAQVTDAIDKPLVLLLDQFEQFFVHYKRAEQRQPFVQALAQWYRAAEPLPVKILVAIRSDLMYQLDDLHQALGYALGPQEVVQLKKFTPEEAATILSVIARAEDLTFERKFVVDLADQELANREDGLISPVDLQILAWMIDRQTSSETRAFSRTAFQKFGGVEGLLQRFLAQTLQARVTQTQRESAVKVLLALTDLDRQVRAGVLTLPALEGKLKGTVKAADVKEAVTWLARGDVRLITPQAQDREVGYELAHERLIPALMQQAGKELSAADQANQLLDRRVNEWLGNHRQSRYWFGPRELWQIERQLPYLVWGPKRRQKEQLLQLSRRRIYGVATGFALVVLVVGGYSSWLLYTPAGQMQRVRTQLWSHLERTNSTFRAAHGAMAYAKHGEWAKADRIIRNHVARQEKHVTWFIQEASQWLPFSQTSAPLGQPLLPLAQQMQDDGYKADALSAITEAYGTLTDDATAALVLDQVLSAAENIQDDGSKAWALSAIAEATGTLTDDATAALVLDQARSAAENIQDDRDKVWALSAIAAATGALTDDATAALVLDQALIAAENIQSDGAKASALSAIAEATGTLTDDATAALVLDQALNAAENIQDDRAKADALGAIAAATGALTDDATAALVLDQALIAAENIQSDWAKASALSAIAEATGTLTDDATAALVLDQARIAAENIQDDGYKADALGAIADATGTLTDDATAAQLLDQALSAAENIQSDWTKASALEAIAAATGALTDDATAAQLLDQARIAAENIQADGDKAYALSAIASAYGALSDDEQAARVLNQTLNAAENIQADGDKANALSAIAAATGTLTDDATAARVLDQTLNVAANIQDDEQKADALGAIASAYGALSDAATAAQVLDQALSAAANIESDNAKASALTSTIDRVDGLRNLALREDLLKTALGLARAKKVCVPAVHLAELYAQQRQWGQALAALRGCGEGEKLVGLTRIFTAAAEAKDLRLIAGAIVIPEGEAGVSVGGDATRRTFEVTVQSPDEDCEQYADWIEVITPAGELKGRRVFTQPHLHTLTFSEMLTADEPIPDDEVVIMRAHFHGNYVSDEDPLVDSALREQGGGEYIVRSGYTDQALRGSVAEGFRSVRLSRRYAAWLAGEGALPDWGSCEVE